MWEKQINYNTFSSCRQCLLNQLHKDYLLFKIWIMIRDNRFKNIKWHSYFSSYLSCISGSSLLLNIRILNVPNKIKTYLLFFLQKEYVWKRAVETQLNFATHLTVFIYIYEYVLLKLRSLLRKVIAPGIFIWWCFWW